MDVRLALLLALFLIPPAAADEEERRGPDFKKMKEEAARFAPRQPEVSGSPGLPEWARIPTAVEQIPWAQWAVPGAVVAAAAVAGALLTALRRRRKEGPREADRDAEAAGRALAVRQADPLSAMEILGLGLPSVLEHGPRGGTIVVRGPVPDGGCAFREGYLSGAIGRVVRETSHGGEACEFEIKP